MNEITYFLRKQIEKHIFQKTRGKENPIINFICSQLPDVEHPFIQKIMRDLEDANNVWMKRKEERTYIEIDITTDRFPRGKRYMNIMPDIRDYIEHQTFLGKEYKFSILEHSFSVSILYFLTKQENHQLNKQQNAKTKDDKKIAHYFEKAFYKIYMWLCLAVQYKLPQCSGRINIYIYLSNSYKLFPLEYADEPYIDMPEKEEEEIETSTATFESNVDAKQINENNANTGLTWACLPETETNEIYIYREEEWFKVLIHETIHSFGIDFAHNLEMMQIAEDRITSKFSLNKRKQYNIFESYTEITAEIIHILIYLFITKKTGVNTQRLQDIFMYEMAFSAFQCAKVLFHNNIDVEKGELLQMTNYKETTNTFSYYILKSGLMIHIKTWLDWYQTTNKESIRFDCTKENIDSYCDLLEKTQDSHEYKMLLQTFARLFSRMDDKKGLFYKTMRMTLLQY
jgi:hypothetical protein